MGSYTISDDAAANLAQLTDAMLERGATLAGADRFIDGLLKKFQMLADFPDLGTPRDYLPPKNARLPSRATHDYLRENSSERKHLEGLIRWVGFVCLFCRAGLKRFFNARAEKSN